MLAEQYDVFLSHNSVDKPLVEQIAQRLVGESKLRPFLDKWHLIPGVEWQPELEDALRRSKTVAVFIGKSGNGPWHHEEMQVALKRDVREKQEFRVIPVLLPDADASSISEFLQLRTWVDFSSGTNNDIAFKRLVAGIPGKADDPCSLSATSQRQALPPTIWWQWLAPNGMFLRGRLHLMEIGVRPGQFMLDNAAAAYSAWSEREHKESHRDVI